MAKCKTCINRKTIDGGMWCDKVSDSYDVDVVRGCEHYKCMTNGDRIRKMTDEELADFLSDPEIFSPCKNCDFHFVDAMNDDCKAPDGWLCTKGYAAALIQKWLQSEVEE